MKNKQHSLKKYQWLSLLIASLFFLSLHSGQAGDKMMVEEQPVPKDWSVELGSGILFSNIRTDDDHSNHTLVPVNLTFALTLDDVSLDEFANGFFRGYSEFLFRANYTQVTFGQENRIAGASIGPRYNFVQEGWPVVPFMEGTVGFGFADSNPIPFPGGDQKGLGQDFNFMFGVNLGFRYDVNDDWFLRFAASYVHYSNAGLSEPQWENKPIDAIGPELSFGMRF